MSVQLLPEKKVAQMLSLSVQTLRNDRAKRQGLPYVKLGAAVRYRVDDVEAYVAARQIRPEAQR